MALFTSNSEIETAAIAAQLAQSCRGDDIFMLAGTLGAGKSVFARAFIQSLMGADTEVPSPTFTLVQTYDTPKGPLWHFDLYRLQSPDEIFEIGWEEAISSGISLVEWPERLGPYVPAKARLISITAGEKTPQQRKIWVDETQA